MSPHVETSNMAEVLYLLERRNCIIEVSMKATWPYGIEELCVTLEGRNVANDHGNYLRYGGQCTLSALQKAFDEVMRVILRQEEQAFFGGQRS